jgi:sodium/potassium-transporting ATPase subunit alpha
VRIHSLTVEQALASLNSFVRRPGRGEAARRLAEFGPTCSRKSSNSTCCCASRRNSPISSPSSCGSAPACRSLPSISTPAREWRSLGLAIVGVIIINGVFSFWQEYKAERAVAALRQLLPQKVKALRAGEIVGLLASELVPGDIVLLEEGDFVPADCRLTEVFGLRVNLSTVTGESLAKARTARAERRGVATAGEEHRPRRHLGRFRAGARRGLRHRHAHRVRPHRPPDADRRRDQLAAAARDRPPVAHRRLPGHRHGPAAVPRRSGHGAADLGELLFAIGIIVANVPEGLLPTVTLSLAMATQRMARRNALVRHLPAVEALGSTTVICSDKTGTLTQNRMSVQQLWIGGAFMPRADLATRTHVVHDHRALFVNAALCHNLKEVDEQGRQSLRGDPMEIALAEIGREIAGDLAGCQRVDEIPFDTDRKRMSVICETPQGRMLYCKGALETVLAGCRFIQFDAGLAPLDPAARTRLLAAQDEMASGGLRVLAFAHRALDEAGVPGDEQGMILAGLIGLEDPPRAEVPEAIARCEEAGIRIIMVTGDHPRTGAGDRPPDRPGPERAAPVVISGEQLRLMSPTQLQLALDAPEILFARVAAEQKMRIVEALKNKGEIVAVTGDGVNDAPALKAADIGIAMGISGTDVAKEAADLILLDDNFASIVAAIEEGRAVFENIRKFLTYILSSNIPELVPYLAFVLFRIPLPLTIIQILAVDLGTDMLPALALGAEKPDPAVMQRPPRARGERLLSWGLLARAYLFPRRPRSGGSDARLLLRPRCRRLAVRTDARPSRPALPAGDLRLPGDDRRHADGQRLPLPPPAPVDA